MGTSCKPPDDTYRKLTGYCVADRDFPDVTVFGADSEECLYSAVLGPQTEEPQKHFILCRL
jgi:hypothetical protein